MNVFLYTFGCKANQYDTEVVRQRLEDAGCVVVRSPEAADAAVGGARSQVSAATAARPRKSSKNHVQ